MKRRKAVGESGYTVKTAQFVPVVCSLYVSSRGGYFSIVIAARLTQKQQDFAA